MARQTEEVEVGVKRATQYFLAVYREDQSDAQYKTFTTCGALLNFAGRNQEFRGPYDVYFVDIEKMIVAPYDIKTLLRVAQKVERAR